MKCHLQNIGHFIYLDELMTAVIHVQVHYIILSLQWPISLGHLHAKACDQWVLFLTPSDCDTPHSALVLLRHIQYCEGVCCVGGGCWSQAGQTRTTDVGYRFFILSVRAESSTLSQGQAIVCRCSGTTCLGGASPTRLFSMKSGR